MSTCRVFHPNAALTPVRRPHHRSIAPCAASDALFVSRLTNRCPRERWWINVHEKWELEWWCHELNVTPEQLVKAVRAVGPMIWDVRKNLGR